MNEKRQIPPPARGPIVEDLDSVGGHDAATNAPVIRPKTTDGHADESVKATDPRERAKKH